MAKRCNYYDRNGNRRQSASGKKESHPVNGCRCRNRFVHPGDREWDLLPPSTCPPFLSHTPPTSPRTLSVPKPLPTSTPKPMPTKEDNERALEGLIRLRADYDTCLERSQKLQQMIEIPPPHGKRESITALRDKADRELTAARTRLREWEHDTPFIFQSPDPVVESSIITLRNLLNDLKLKLAEAEALQKEVAARAQVTSVNPVEQVDQDGDITMDVTPLPTASSKRKRMSSPPASATAALSSRHVVKLQNEYEMVAERVAHVEENAEAEDEEIFEMLHQYLEEWTSDKNSSSGGVDEIHARIDQVDHRLAKLVSTAVIADYDKLDQEGRKLVIEHNQQDVELRKLERRLEELQRERERDDSEIEGLSAALTSYLEKPISRPASPFDPEEIVTDLESQIKQLVREIIRPHIDGLRSEIIDEMTKRDSDVFNTVLPKLTMTNRAMQGISSLATS